MSTEVDALQARLQAYEHRETQWKQQLEKAQHEHSQLQSYQQKLTQAGTHLKALATDNARLQQELNRQTSASGQVEEQLKKDRDDLATQLEQQKQSNMSTIVHLLDHLTLDTDNDNDDDDDSSASSSAKKPISTKQQLPDVSDLEQVRHYIETTVSKINLKAKGKDTTIAALKSDIEHLQFKIQDIEQHAEKPQSPIHPPSPKIDSLTTTAGDGLSVDFLEQNIKGIINDADNFTVDSSSLPPQLMATLEHLRGHLQTLAETRKTTLHQNVDEIKELKRQITQLQMSVNEWSEEKEQWMEKEELENQMDNDQATKDKAESFDVMMTEYEQHKNELTQLQTEHQSLLAEIHKCKNLLELSSLETKEYIEALSQMKAEQQPLLEKVADLETQLTESKSARQQSDDQVARLQQEHQALLDKIAHIKETLAPRLEADKQLRVKVTELTTELEQTKQSLDEMRTTMVARDDEAGQQLENKDRHLHQLQNRLEKLQQEREELEMAAMELDTRCSHLEQNNAILTNDLEICKKQMADEQQSSASERANMENLQSVLEEFQTIKDAEIRAAVEHIERQLEVAKKSWTEYQERARLAESSLEQYQHDVAKTPQYEREIKEKNLLIGKLRHEAIILNEHLVEAMRRLKEESNESNVDRQLITNLVVGFLMAPRGDRKRFDILTIIANVLQMTDEQKEQVGLIRMKNNGNGQRSSNSSPSGTGWQSPRQQQEMEPKESFTDAWISFLLKESSKRKPSASSPNASPHSDQVDI